MHVASLIEEETRPAYCEPVMLPLDGQRYWRTAETGCLKPVLTRVTVSHITPSPERDWLKDLDDRNSINCRLATYDRQFWTFELNDKALAAFHAAFADQAVAA